MRSNRKLFAIIALAVLCTQCCSYHKHKNRSQDWALLLFGGSTTTVPQTPSGSLAEALDAARTAARTKSISAAIIKGDGTPECAVSNAPGGTNPVTADTRFSIGSCTKMFIAAAVLKLVEENRLGLDDTLQQLLYGPGILGDAYKARINPSIRVRDLLYHRTGISDYLEDSTYYTAIYAGKGSTWDYGRTLTYVGTPDYAYNAVNTGNNTFKYSNTNYIILGIIIEQVTGKKVLDSVTGYFLSPLGLATTYMAGVEPYLKLTSIPGDMAVGYEKDLWGSWIKSSTYISEDAVAMYSSTWTCGNMVSTASDMARWVKSFYQMEQSKGYLSDDLFRAGSISSDYFTERSFGYGIEKVRHMSGCELWGHTGTIMGFNSLVFYIPSKDISVAILVNDHYPERWTILHVVLGYINTLQ